MTEQGWADTIAADCIPYWNPDERTAWSETDAWLNAEASRFSKMMALTRKPIEYAYSKVPESLRESIASAILGVLTTVRNGTAGLVSMNGVDDKLPPIPPGPHGHFRIGVRNADSVAQTLISQSKNACTAEGAATGLAGLPGIVVDIPALYGLLFRMLAQVAHCYGFPVEDEQEREHLLKVLDVGHRQEPQARREGMDELAQLQTKIGSDVPIVEAQRFAAEKSLQTMARHLGLALTQRKLAQSVALVGGVVGAGVNRQLASEIGEVAFHTYRRRYLLEVARLRRDGTFAMADGKRLDGQQAANPSATASTPPCARNRHSEMLGVLRARLSATESNLLLKEFVKDGDLNIGYRAGQFVVETKRLTLTTTSLPLADTALTLETPLGTAHLEIADLRLNPTYLELDLRLGFD